MLRPGWDAEVLSVLLPGRSVTLVSAIPDSLAELSLFLWLLRLSDSFRFPSSSVSAPVVALWLLEMVSPFTKKPSASVSYFTYLPSASVSILSFLLTFLPFLSYSYTV